jgi:transcription antitermination factor NusG
MGLRMAEPCAPSDHVAPTTARGQRQWYAVQVTPRHEKRVTANVEEKRIPVFLPLVSEMHHWSDRQKRVDIPLFLGYTFVQLSTQVADRVAVLRTSGVLRLVGAAYTGTPIPDKQIDDIAVLVNSRLRLDPYPFLNVGDRVRIRNGSLAGLEGILVGKNSDATLVVSIDLLRRSLAVRIHGFDLHTIGRAHLASAIVPPRALAG